MEPTLREKQWSNRFEEFGRNADLERAFAALEDENARLKQLVVQLSATILQNVTRGP